MAERKFMPGFAELIDRMSIDLLKEVKIPEHKQIFVDEKNIIMEDIDTIIKEKKITLTADLIHAIIVCAQMNEHIWYNESSARLGVLNKESMSPEQYEEALLKLRLTHSINGIRSIAKNTISFLIGDKDKMDYKVDCVASDYKAWDIKWREK
jgi:hypothetical protein